MARRKQGYSGERYTAALRLQLTPSERAKIEAGAAGQGIHISEYSRRRILNGAVAMTDRAQITALIDVLAENARQVAAIGNNLNQIARHCNTTGEFEPPELERAIGVFEEVVRQQKAALRRVLAL